MADDRAIEAVAQALGYQFERGELLEEALTHRSFANEQPKRAPRDNERLEFLGDAVVGLVVSTLLWDAFPEAPEGELTRRRADLVCEAALAAIARDLGLGAALRLGKGEEKSRGREKPRLLSSALEACMGAIFLDGGGEAALSVGRRIFAPRLASQAPGARDFKSRVQELAQAAGAGTPVYELLETSGPDHERTFRVRIRIGEAFLAEGQGRSKGDAEQDAARSALPRFATLPESRSAEEAP